MKLYNQKDNLIIFEKYKSYILDTDNISLTRKYLTVKDFVSYFDDFISYTKDYAFNIKTRYTFSILDKGFLFISEYSLHIHTIGIVCNQNDKLILYYYTDNKYTNILNKFAKYYNIERKNKIELSYNDLTNKFILPVKINIEDYDENVQNELSKEFIDLTLIENV